MNRAMRRPWQRKAAGAWAEQGTARQPHVPCAHPAPAGPHPDGLATQRMTCRGPPQETTAPTGRCCRSVRREEGLHAADGCVRLKAARNGLPGCRSASRSVVTPPIVLDRDARRHAAPAGLGFTGARKFTAHDAGLGRLRLQPKHLRPGVHRICGSPQQGAKDECAPGDAHPAAAGGSQASQIVKYSHTPRTAGKGLQETMQQAQQAAECGRQTAAGSASGRTNAQQAPPTSASCILPVWNTATGSQTRCRQPCSKHRFRLSSQRCLAACSHACQPHRCACSAVPRWLGYHFVFLPSSPPALLHVQHDATRQRATNNCQRRHLAPQILQ